MPQQAQPEADAGSSRTTIPSDIGIRDSGEISVMSSGKKRKAKTELLICKVKNFSLVLGFPLREKPKGFWLVISNLYLGAVWFTKVLRFAAVRKLICTAHWELMRGNDEQAIAYCMKDDTRVDGPWEHGQKPKAGKRTDIANLAEDLQSGHDLDTLYDSHLPVILKYSRGFEKARAHYQRRRVDKFRQVTCIVCWGPTRSGKTRSVYERHYGNLYIADHWPWFDNYDGEKILLLDDFYGGIPAHKLLRIMDGYRMDCAVKGGFVPANWNMIYFTSNIPPCEWYTKLDETGRRHDNLTPEVREALNARITKVIYFPSPGVQLHSN